MIDFLRSVPFFIRFGWKYLKISLHSAMTWGPGEDVEDNDRRLAAMYPKEWAELEAMKNQELQRILDRDLG